LQKYQLPSPTETANPWIPRNPNSIG